MSNVFISYHSADREIAARLSQMLQSEGQTVFYDSASIVAGESFSAVIEEALNRADAVVVLLSKNSNRSQWVEAEIRSALEGSKLVIPVLLDEQATHNWVWPLISDRNAIVLDSPTQLGEVVERINRAVGFVSGPASAYPRPPKASSSSWVIPLIAVLSAVAGALITWLLFG